MAGWVAGAAPARGVGDFVLPSTVRHHAVIDACPSSREVAAAFERSQGQRELGPEALVLLGELDHGGAVRGNLEGLDRFGQRLEHPPSVHQFVRQNRPQNAR